jgi:hypothetical protein
MKTTFTILYTNDRHSKEGKLTVASYRLLPVDDRVAGDRAMADEIETFKMAVTGSVFTARGYSIDQPLAIAPKNKLAQPPASRVEALGDPRGCTAQLMPPKGSVDSSSIATGGGGRCARGQGVAGDHGASAQPARQEVYADEHARGCEQLSRRPLPPPGAVRNDRLDPARSKKPPEKIQALIKTWFAEVNVFRAIG